MSDSQDVGYGKPPSHTQFKKGQSGNPKGRPKRKYRKDPLAIADTIGNKKTAIVENGRTKYITFREAYIRRIYIDAIQGKAYAAKLLHDMFTKDIRLRKNMNDVFMDGLIKEFWHN